jgi:hypothetical protein
MNRESSLVRSRGLGLVTGKQEQSILIIEEGGRLMKVQLMAILAVLATAVGGASSAFGDCCPCPIVIGTNPYKGKPPPKPNPDDKTRRQGQG